jgi:copper chaperone
MEAAERIDNDFSVLRALRMCNKTIYQRRRAMNTVSYFVPSISCGNCKQTIERNLGKLPGVQFVQVDLAAKRVAITFDAPATEEEIKALLVKIDYPVLDDSEPSTDNRCCCR